MRAQDTARSSSSRALTPCHGSEIRFSWGQLAEHGKDYRRKALLKSPPVGVGKRTASDGAETQLHRLAVLMGEYSLDGADGVVAGHVGKEQGSEPDSSVHVLLFTSVLSLGFRSRWNAVSFDQAIQCLSWGDPGKSLARTTIESGSIAT